MSLTDVTLCGKTLCSPVIAASGTFGFGGEYAGIVDMKKLGGISGKGLTLEGKYGNEGERLWETPAGLINSIGLQNPGVRHFIEYELPGMKKLGPAVLANLGGSTIETYEEGARLLDETNVDFIELNISCPNVKAGGIAYGVKAESAREVVSRVRACTKKPLIVKLSPNAENITEMALACEAAGADGLSLINTLLALRIDPAARRPVLKNLTGGLSGPAVFPVALRMVWQVYEAVEIPIIGMGGVSSAEDAVEMLLAGATAVGVGAANLRDPFASRDIASALPAVMERYGIDKLEDIIGGAHNG